MHSRALYAETEVFTRSQAVLATLIVKTHPRTAGKMAQHSTSFQGISVFLRALLAKVRALCEL